LEVVSAKEEATVVVAPHPGKRTVPSDRTGSSSSSLACSNSTNSTAGENELPNRATASSPEIIPDSVSGHNAETLIVEGTPAADRPGNGRGCKELQANHRQQEVSVETSSSGKHSATPATVPHASTSWSASAPVSATASIFSPASYSVPLPTVTPSPHFAHLPRSTHLPLPPPPHSVGPTHGQQDDTNSTSNTPHNHVDYVTEEEGEEAVLRLPIEKLWDHIFHQKVVPSIVDELESQQAPPPQPPSLPVSGRSERMGKPWRTGSSGKDRLPLRQDQPSVWQSQFQELSSPAPSTFVSLAAVVSTVELALANHSAKRDGVEGGGKNVTVPREFSDGYGSFGHGRYFRLVDFFSEPSILWVVFALACLVSAIVFASITIFLLVRHMASIRQAGRTSGGADNSSLVGSEEARASL
ncbi:unnamed protein product, partial [Protopolystoma xenopodis]